MEKRYGKWKKFCLWGDPALFPEGTVFTDAPFDPLVCLTEQDPETSRGLWRAADVSDTEEEEGVGLLEKKDPAVSGFSGRGFTILNTAFSRAFDYLESHDRIFREDSGEGEKPKLRVNLVGLGDVGGTVLTALKLLGKEIGSIGIHDYYETQCARYEMEMNQVLPLEHSLPKVFICPEDELFDCDVFIFTASRGVPGLDTKEKDVRMAQYAANKEMLSTYARKAREKRFSGLFCQVSDPVDHLSRAVFLESNRDGDGRFDAGGLLPEQIRGFGLGVMKARACYYAEKEGIDFTNGRVYGPHGNGLIAANDPDSAYDGELSEKLTYLTQTANHRVRELGFKPYIAPGLSSAARSVLALLRGQEHESAVPFGGVYFGCVNRDGPEGTEIIREKLHPELKARLEATYRMLKDFSY